MKSKPDLLWILTLIFGLGIVTTGYTQSIWEHSYTEKIPTAYEVQTMLAPYTNTDR